MASGAKERADLVVLGGGPGGYVAALRAADLGREVVLVDERAQVGGVCLLEGCIPSKALITAVELAESARSAKRMGLTFSDLAIDTAQLAKYKASVVGALAKGVASLLKQRGVEVIQGRGRLAGPGMLALEGADRQSLAFDHCILATGSRPVELPFARDRGLWTSREALELDRVPERLLVVGGGYIGLELGLVYAGLGSKVSCVELMPTLLSGADEDLVAHVFKSCKKRFDEILLETRVTAVESTSAGFAVTFEDGSKQTSRKEYDQVLVAVGRRPNTDDIGLDRVGLAADARGLLPTDGAMRTAVAGVFAIGDIVAGPGLAHKASREGKIAAGVIAGRPEAFDNVSVPAIVFTDPELAWVGMTEAEARAAGRQIRVGRFPLTALGRARTLGRTDGMAKVIVDEQRDNLVLGVGIVGPHASELIAGPTLALEMGATVEDISATIHPHPTLSESVAEAAEVAERLGVHIYPPYGR